MDDGAEAKSNQHPDKYWDVHLICVRAHHQVEWQGTWLPQQANGDSYLLIAHNIYMVIVVRHVLVHAARLENSMFI